MTALRNADAAGDIEAAQRIAAMIKAQAQQTPELAQVATEQPPQYQSDSEIPIESEIGLPPKPKPQQPERPLLDTIYGGGEAAVALFTGLTGGTFGMVAGTLDQTIKEAVRGEFGTPEAANRIEAQAAAAADALTRTPKTEAGQDILGEIGEALAPLEAIAPQLTPGMAPLRQSVARSRLSKLPKPDLTDAPFVKNKSALKTLGGDIKSAKLVNLIEQSSAATKKQMGKMLNMISKGRKRDMSARPSDIVGEAGTNRARDILRINKKASNDIGSIAKKQGNKSVNLATPKENFFKSLDDLNVTFTRGEDGWVTPDFSRSKFAGGSQKDMTVLINDLLKDKIGFETAHKLKQSVRENLNFDPLGKGKVTGDSAKILRDLSSQINKSLTKVSKPYEKANLKFAKTVELKQKLQKMAGKDIDLFAEGESASALGDKIKRITSNATSRTSIAKTMNEVDKTLKELGVTYKDNITDLSNAANHLERVFKIEQPGSLKGTGAELLERTARGESLTLQAIGYVAKKLSPSEQAIYNKNMKTLRKLIKEPLKKKTLVPDKPLNISAPLDKAGGRLKNKINRNPSEAINEYNAIPDSNGGKVLNTDIARELSADYLRDRSLSASVHEPASAFIKRRYRQILKEAPRPGEDAAVLFTAGGTGAGKTTGLKGLVGTGKYQVVYDTNMSSLGSAKKKINQALTAGKKVDIVMVYRDPVEAFLNGSLKRSIRQTKETGTGRTVPLKDHINSHRGSLEVVGKLKKIYKDNDNVTVNAIDNSRGKGQQSILSVEQLDKFKGRDYNKVRKDILKLLEKSREAKEITAKTLKGFKGG